MFKTLSKIFLIFLTGVIFTSAANAAVLSREYLNSEVSEQISQQLKSTVTGELKVQIAPVYFEEIPVSDGEITIKSYLKDKSFSPRKMAAVEVFVNGKLEKKFMLAVDLKIYDNVWCATGMILRDKNFTSNNVEIQRKDITNDYENVLRADTDLSEYVANKNFRISETISKKFIKQKPDILKNSTISALLETQSIQISFDVEATENGCIGDVIKVKSKRYNRYYVGEVINKNTVLVKM